MRIAVTGAGGTMGSRVVATAREAGHEVVAIDRAASGLPTRAPDLRPYVFELSDFGSLVSAVRGCDALIHLAAYVNPWAAPEPMVHNSNVVSSYNALAAAEANGIRRVCLASSINAIGAFYSATPRYDYFPIDEDHPCYAEDAYSLSKWFAEEQARAFVRRQPDLSVVSLRLHALVPEDRIEERVARGGSRPDRGSKDLWGYTPLGMAADAALAAVTRDLTGAEVVYVVAERTCSPVGSAQLAAEFYPDVPLREPLSEHRSFYSGAKYAKLLSG